MSKEEPKNFNGITILELLSILQHQRKLWGFPKSRTINFLIKNNFCLKIFFKVLIYLFLAALGLRCCMWASSSCGEQGLLFVAVRGLLIVVASLVAEHGL